MRAEFQHLQIPLPIAIIGLGLSGRAVHQLLLALGVDSKEILTFDPKETADFQSPEELMKSGKPRSLCVSPGVPLQQAWIQEALSSGLRLTSELEIAFSFVTTEKVIGITGSVGKSTTTSILGAGAKVIDPLVFVGGNLGMPLANYSREVLQGSRRRSQYIVLELSSYQLENFKNFKTHVSILTHLSPNHLERYQNLQHYYQTKLTLFQQTLELGILNRSGGHISSLIAPIQKVNPKLKWVWTDRSDPAFKKLLVRTPQLVGAHNLDNLSLAFAAAQHFGWPDGSFRSMEQFPGLEHRLENCGTIDDILFLNDSKATTVDSVLQAVESIRHQYPTRRVHLLLGGKDKNLPWSQLASLQKEPQFHFSFFGEVGSKAQKESALQGTVFTKLSDCLQSLKLQLKSGDLVLFSPGGTSLDEFKNFEERGKFFKNWILTEFQNRHG